MAYPDKRLIKELRIRFVEKGIDNLSREEIIHFINHQTEYIRELESEKQFNNLTPAEAERLFLLLEELGEAQQAIGKILRHGYNSGHPNSNVAFWDNRNDLEKELAHIKWAVEFMASKGDIERKNIDSHYLKKGKEIFQYLHHHGK